MTNKNLERLSTLQMTQPSAVTITSGEPLLFGSATGHKLPCVAAQEKSTVTPVPPYDTVGDQFTADFEGVFNLTVVGKSSISPGTGAAIAKSDVVYLDSPTFDATTGLSYGGTLNANSSTGIPFGIALDAVGSGATAVIRVLLANGAK